MRNLYFQLSACVLLVVAGPGCGSEINTQVDTSECFYCHSESQLEETLPSALSSPAEHMSVYGSGVRVSPSYDPTEKYSWGFEWIKRGYHDEEALKSCSPCHNTLDETKHGGFFYPVYSHDEMYVAENCAGSCHRWLYLTPWEPQILLMEDGNPHGVLYRRGYKGESRRIKLSEIKPGCGGCHSVLYNRHGSVPECLTCHNFYYEGGESDPHSAHLARLGNNESSCGWCHGGYGDPRYRAACYNCHESGHNPK